MFESEYPDDAITWGPSWKGREVNMFEETGGGHVLYRTIYHGALCTLQAMRNHGRHLGRGVPCPGPLSHPNSVQRHGGELFYLFTPVTLMSVTPNMGLVIDRISYCVTSSQDSEQHLTQRERGRKWERKGRGKRGNKEGREENKEGEGKRRQRREVRNAERQGGRERGEIVHRKKS